MAWQAMPYMILLIVTAVISAASALYVWLRHPLPGNKTAVLIALASAGWLVGYALELGSVDALTKDLWNKVQYVGIVILPAAWLAFTLQYTGHEKWLTRRNLCLLSIEPLVTLLLVFTNEAHGLIWERAALDTVASFSVLARPHGVGYWIHMAYTYTLLLITILLLIQMLLRSRHLYRRQAGVLLFASFLPLLGNVLMQFGLNPLPYLDLTPLAVTVSGLILTWSLFRLRLGDIVPVACRMVIESMSDGVIVLDEQSRIVDLNAVAQRVVGHTASEAIGQPVEWAWPDWSGLVERSCDSTGVSEEVTLDKGDVQRTYDVCVSPIVDWRGRLTSRVVVLRDVTERKRTEEALQEQAERLRILREIDGAILAAQSPEALAQAALRRTRRLVPCQRASVALFDLEASEGVVLAAHGRGETRLGEGERFSLDAWWGDDLCRGEAYVVESFQDLSQLSPIVQALQAEGLCSCLVAPLVSQGELIGSLNLWSDSPGAFTPEHVQVASELADSLAVAVQQAQLYQSVRRQEEQLRTLTARLAEAEEAERRRLVQELHDQVGGNLTALSINLNLVRTHMPEGTLELVHSHLDNALALVEETTARIRCVMADLRPPTLDDYGLVATLHWYGAQFASRTGIAVTVRGEELVPRLPALAENALFRIAQEVLTNVAKHAQATQVIVTVTADDGAVRLVVADDGVGFDPAQLARPDGCQGWGLITMTERARAVGDCCRIESRPRQGTRVIVEVTR